MWVSFGPRNPLEVRKLGPLLVFKSKWRLKKCFYIFVTTPKLIKYAGRCVHATFIVLGFLEPNRPNQSQWDYPNAHRRNRVDTHRSQFAQAPLSQDLGNCKISGQRGDRLKWNSSSEGKGDGWFMLERGETLMSGYTVQDSNCFWTKCLTQS
jgi:hypothetical protein